MTQIDVSGASAQTYTITSGGAGSLTLTGTDGSAQTLTGLTDFAVNETKVFNFSNLGVSMTLQAGPAVKTIANTIVDLTAAANDTIVVTGTGAAQLQVGANNGDNLSISFSDMQTVQLGAASNLNALITNDQKAFSALQRDGKVELWSDLSVLERVDRSGDYSKVRFTSGEHEGKLFWMLSDQFLRKPTE